MTDIFNNIINDFQDYTTLAKVLFFGQLFWLGILLTRIGRYKNILKGRDADIKELKIALKNSRKDYDNLDCKLDDLSPERWLNVADTEVNAGNYNRAYHKLLHSIKGLEPDIAKVYHRLAEYSFAYSEESKHLCNAKLFSDKAVTLLPNNSEYLVFNQELINSMGTDWKNQIQNTIDFDLDVTGLADTPRTLTALSTLVSNNVKQGSFRLAYSLSERGYIISQRDPTVYSKYIALFLSNMTTSKMYMQDFVQALEITDTLINFCEKNEGLENYHIMAINAKANSLVHLGSSIEALKHLEKYSPTLGEKYEQESLHTFKRQYANVLYNLHRGEEAIEILTNLPSSGSLKKDIAAELVLAKSLERVNDKKKYHKLMSSRYPDIMKNEDLRMSQRLLWEDFYWRSLWYIGKTKEAFALYKKSHKRSLEYYGPNHTYPKTAQYYYSFFLYCDGKLEEAISQIEALIDNWPSNLSRSSTLLHAKQTLAHSYIKLGINNTKAKELLEDIYPIQLETLTEDNNETQLTKTLLDQMA